MTKDHNHIQYLIGNPPTGIVKKGNFVVLLLILTLVILSAVIRYPDMLEGITVITGEKPPVSLYAKSTGAVKLFCDDKEYVKKGDILAYIDNSADREEVELLAQLLVPVKSQLANLQVYQPILGQLMQFEHLGELQGAYQQFVTANQELSRMVDIGSYQAQLQNKQVELAKYNELLLSTDHYAEILRSEYDLADEKLAMNKTLFEEGHISKAVCNETQSAVLQAKSKLQQAENDKANCAISISQLESEVSLLTNEKQQQEELRLGEVVTAYNLLIGKMDEWKEKYQIIAPVSGEVVFTNVWSDLQNSNEGEHILNIIPKSGQHYYGRLDLPMKSAGKVTPGQLVLVELDNYPCDEFGVLKGEVSHISQVSNNENYLVIVTFPDTLVTSGQFTIKQSPELQGTGRIMTNNRSFLGRVLGKLAVVFEDGR